MIKRSIFLLCLLFSCFGTVSHAAEPLSWPVEISELHTPSVDTFLVASGSAQAEECGFSLPVVTTPQIPCYRYLLYEYQQLVTVQWQANRLATVAHVSRRTRLPYLLSRSDLEAPKTPSCLS